VYANFLSIFFQGKKSNEKSLAFFGEYAHTSPFCHFLALNNKAYFRLCLPTPKKGKFHWQFALSFIARLAPHTHAQHNAIFILILHTRVPGPITPSLPTSFLEFPQMAIQSMTEHKRFTPRVEKKRILVYSTMSKNLFCPGHACGLTRIYLHISAYISARRTTPSGSQFKQLTFI